MYGSLQEATQPPHRALGQPPFCVLHWLGRRGCLGQAGRGGGEICWQIIEFFELEGPWKVEKGPGGHEREKKKKRPSGIVCRDFSLKPVGKLELVSAFFWGRGGGCCTSILCREETLCTWVSGGWGEMLGTSVICLRGTCCVTSSD